MATGKKFYWLKLEKDFFKRHDIRIVEAMPNGKDYILFYLKLLCESTSHDGNLRFSETIPYDIQMLSVVTNTNVDIAEKSIRIFTELGMMETLDDGTIYMNEINKMLGYETDWARKKREQRDNRENVPLVSPPCPPNVRQEKEIDIEIDKKEEEKEIHKEKEKKKGKFVKPTLEEVKEYCEKRKNNIDPEMFYNFYESKNWMIGKNKVSNWKACVITWERNRVNGNPNPNKTVKETPEWFDEYERKLKEQSKQETKQPEDDSWKNLFK